MKLVLVVATLVVAGSFAFMALTGGPSDEGAFHPDHTRVFNGFQDATSELVGEVSSVEPDSNPKQINDSKWRCYRRWAPVGRPAAAEIIRS